MHTGQTETQKIQGHPITHKPVLVWVHGYLGGSQQWANQLADFSAYHLMMPDLPGFSSKHMQPAPECIAGFAQHILDQLSQQGVSHFHLLGHSMGGMIAQQMVALVPQRVNKLILYGTGPLGIMPGRFEPIAESKRHLQQEGVIPYARRIAAKWFVNGEDSPAYAACADIATQASMQAALAGLTAMENWSGVANLAQIQSPTLVLWGDQDQSYQWALPEQLWRGIDNAQLGVVPGGGHAVHLEKPSLFNALVQDFLNDAP